MNTSLHNVTWANITSNYEAMILNLIKPEEHFNISERWLRLRADDLKNHDLTINEIRKILYKHKASLLIDSERAAEAILNPFDWCP